MIPLQLLDLYWLVCVFVLGAVVGSFLNVAIARLPLEKSLVWPGSRCGHCLQPVRWHDNLPLVSYLRLRGRCRTCGQRFSIAYFLVELGTAVGFAALFYAEVMQNVHRWPGGPGPFHPTYFPWQWWVGYFYHAALFAFLMAASVCDLRSREIPLQLTLTGTAVGLVGAVLLPWPWPWPPEGAGPPPVAMHEPAFAWQAGGEIQQGVYPWPVWGPLPEMLAPGGNWQTGLATGLAGALVGTFLLRGIGSVFGAGLGKEALGLGDADLMMMAGAFLGWQPVVIAFFVSVAPALFFGILQVLFRNDNSLPFGPSLSMGVMMTCVGWHWIAQYPAVPMMFFWGPLLFWLVVAGAGFLFMTSFALRVLRG